MTNNQAKDSGAQDAPQYDPHIVPAETAARKEREGDNFGNIHGDVTDESGDTVSHESIDVTGGQTIDKEGLSNNFAIEPEMYVDQPGDLRAEEEAEAATRSQELDDVQHNEEQGKLTADGDTRSKGPGMI